jgi:putative ABC transport system permease protein
MLSVVRLLSIFTGLAKCGTHDLELSRWLLKHHRVKNLGIQWKELKTMLTLLQDLRYGVRMLSKRPGFSVAVIITLTLGIGVNAAIFSVANNVLLRPLPFPQPEELVMVWETAPRLGFPRNNVAPANFIDWREQNRSFSYIAVFGGDSLSLTGRGDPERIEGQRVSASLFPLLGVAPVLGRTFTAEEDSPNGPGVIVLSHGLWQRRFGSDASIIGQSLTLNRHPYTVIGVMPPQFRFLTREQEYWTPIALGPEESAGRGDHYLSVVARLKPGVTMQQAQSEMEAIAARLQQQYPRTNTDQGVALVPLHEEFAGNVRKPLLILLGVVGFVLLIACANVTNLLLARVTERRKELTIREALGASRWRVARQLLTESLLLALIGGALGSLIAFIGISLLETLIPDSLSPARGAVLDWRVLGFALVISMLTGIVCGLLPLLRGSGINLTSALKEGGQSSTSGDARNRMRSVLVVVELALSLVLLTGAGLLIRSFYRLSKVEPGFEANNVLTLRMQLGGASYGEPTQRRAFYDRMLQQLEAIPGVQEAGVTTQLPLTGQGTQFSFSLEGQPPLSAAHLPQAAFRVVSSDYFRTLGVPLMQGRTFTSQDTAEAQAVSVINQTMAHRFWPGQEAVGKRFKIGSSDSPNPWMIVVGVVGDVRQTRMDQALIPEMYVSYQQDKRFFAIPRDLAVRTAGDPLNVFAAVRSEIWKLDKDLPLFRVRTMNEVVSQSVAAHRFNMLLLAIFAMLAFILAVVGIYGVMSYSTAQRTREIGIRISLGANPRDVLSLVMRRGLLLTLGGVISGLLGALVLTRVMSGLLFDVSTTDPITFALIAMLLTVVSAIACYIPAIAATKINPLEALRSE